MRLGVGLGFGFGLVRQLSSQASAASSCQVCGIGVFRRLLYAVSRAIVRHLGSLDVAVRIPICGHTLYRHTHKRNGYAVCGMRYSVGLILPMSLVSVLV